MHKLTGSISLNDLVYNSTEIGCTALLWSPNHTLWPEPFGPVTVRVHACTRFVSSRLNSRRLDERGCVRVMRLNGVMSLLGSGTRDSWGHLLWEEFTCPIVKMASRWLDGQGIYRWTVLCGASLVWKQRFNMRSISCVYGQSVWPYRWRISLAGSSSAQTRWDEVGGLIYPDCSSLPKTFMKRGKGEISMRWSISRCSHKRAFSHYTFISWNSKSHWKKTQIDKREVIFQHKLGGRVFRSPVWPPGVTEPAKVRPYYSPAGSSSSPWRTSRLIAVRWNTSAS